MRRVSQVLLSTGMMAMFTAGSATAQTPTTQPARPAYSVEPWTENWSFLKDPANRSDFLDPIKYIPLDAAGDVYLSLGGQVRERYEYFNNNLFGAGPQDGNGYYLTRLLAHADLHLGSNVRVYAEIKSALEDHRNGGPRPTDSDEFDLQQAFVDFRIPFGAAKDGFTIRAGRQDLLYGAQRLIGPLDWSNTRRTFEGVRGMLVTGDNQLDLFWTRPVVVNNKGVNDGDRHAGFAGIYDTLSVPAMFDPAAKSKLEAYGLVLNQTARPAFDTAPAIAVNSDTYTIGTRLSSNPKPFDFDIEADYQFGRSGAGRIDAYSVASDVGYTIADVILTPRLCIGFDIASGDRDPANPDTQTFNQLFPTGHMYFGYIDAIGRENIMDLHPGLQLSLLKNRAWAQDLSLRTDYHVFWRQSTESPVFNAAGGVLRAAPGNDDQYIGSELDVLLNWQVNTHLSSYVGYSHFFAGDFIRDTGPGNDIDFAYAAVQYTF